jgi:ATP-dependent exoDNAse (exonuclease V) beta subunit
MKEPQNEGAAFGSVLHAAAAETVERGKFVLPNWKKLYAKEGITEPADELIEITDEYFENWLDHTTLTGKRPENLVATEKEYTVPVEGLGTFTGKIDAIFREDNGDYTVIDYKFMKDATKKKSNIQMAVYSLLEPKARTFVYEKVGLSDYEEQVVHNLVPALQKIKVVVQCIKEGKFEAKPKGIFAQYCPFLKECGECQRG